MEKKRGGGIEEENEKHRALIFPISFNPGSRPQKGIVTYAISANRQRPLAGALHAAIFNTARRTKDQLLYWLPTTLIGYVVLKWAIDRYVLFQLVRKRPPYSWLTAWPLRV
jgi:ubiquinol-cytochrome c reductase subunit 8